MYYPSLETVEKLSANYNMIPIRLTFMADHETPISIYQKLRRDKSFLLESVEGGARWGRYSFIGLRPLLTFESKEGRTRVEYRDGRFEQKEGNPVHLLRDALARYRSPALPEMPRFTGGAVGYFGFDILSYFEQLPVCAHDDLGMDDVKFMFADSVIAFDHLKQEIQVIEHLHVEAGDSMETIRAKYDDCCSRIWKMAERIRNADEPARALYMMPQTDEPIEVKSNMTKAEFLERVEKAKSYISVGEVSQVVLSQRFEVEDPPAPFDVYRVLRSLNPSPYMYYLQFSEDEILVGASPELLVRVEDGKVETRPIAGTRKRGKTEAEDQALVAELLADEKERAEHDMLVELGKEDIEKVCEAGSVEVEQYLVVEFYSHVMHIVSHVAGKLDRGKSPFDALIACFPAGTVSGAPKRRAMEIIAELEQSARNAYAGAIGYFSFNGNMDSCITIRTIVYKDGGAYIQAGAGIVSDSIPEKEFEETENKAKALIRAIQVARQIKRLEEEEEHVSDAAK